MFFAVSIVISLIFSYFGQEDFVKIIKDPLFITFRRVVLESSSIPLLTNLDYLSPIQEDQQLFLNAYLFVNVQKTIDFLHIYKE